MNEKLVDLYFDNLKKFRNGKISQEFWYEICANILSQIMLNNYNDQQ